MYPRGVVAYKCLAAITAALAQGSDTRAMLGIPLLLHLLVQR